MKSKYKIVVEPYYMDDSTFGSHYYNTANLTRITIEKRIFYL